MVVLPKQIVLAKGWKHGQPLQARITDKGHIEIKEMI